MKVLALTDNHGRRITIEEGELDLIVISGDITQFGGYDEAREVIEPIVRLGIRLLAVPGNCDYPGVGKYLDEIRANCDGRIISVDNLTFAGLGGSNPTPCNTPNEFPEEDLTDKLTRFSNRDISVLITHPPPFNTLVDRTASGGHAGSKAVRNFIESAKPNLVLCGHIHEAGGEDWIGLTRIINPGPGPGVIIDL
ncbi:MAG TPA: hypothetical protein EYP24_05335 [bacterium (Candidatus Stahlbacteria)]|nr:hypothetical protein [Candidatus Stahlbacteria bacterium]